MNLGIIAEDNSDVAVVRVLTLKLIRPQVAGFKRFVGDGCGKLRKKCEAWSKSLVQQGCCCIVVIHDLDRSDEGALRAQLSAAVASSKAKASVILIPRQEIEAWLLYDAEAIAKVFSKGDTPKLKGDPESLPDPKKHLTDLVWKTYRKRYYHTIHNERVANGVDTALLKKSKSFAPHFEFCAAVKKLLS